ncbi:hypothetical protein GZH53_17465 [Flavihumibacter sp. R14]|nr:hypothetical protein [Flavihumibacter soli]
MNLRLPLLLLTCLIVLCSYSSYAQKAKYVGLTGTLETSTRAFKPGFGFHYEQRFTRRSALETGLFFRNYSQGGAITFSDGSNSIFSSINVAERYLSIPALYKFHTKIVNISAGPSFEFYLGWKQTNRDPIIKLDEYYIDPAFHIGLIAKISKDIRVNKQLIVEPEIRWNPILTSERGYWGLGIAAKYKL